MRVAPVITLLLGVSAIVFGLSGSHAQSRADDPDTTAGPEVHPAAQHQPSGDSSTATPGVTKHTIGGAQSATSLPLLIDGAKTPELISDDLAYRQFIMATAGTAVATGDELARRNAFLDRVGLSATDREKFVSALASTGRDLDDATWNAIDARAKKARRDAVFGKARVDLGNALSPGGSARLLAHVREHVKPRIRIYGQK